jgi:hypothetical protein
MFAAYGLFESDDVYIEGATVLRQLGLLPDLTVV